MILAPFLFSQLIGGSLFSILSMKYGLVVAKNYNLLVVRCSAVWANSLATLVGITTIRTKDCFFHFISPFKLIDVNQPKLLMV